jgi:hypothetical protein
MIEKGSNPQCIVRIQIDNYVKMKLNEKLQRF